jgi:hypothetical protein
MGGGGGGGSTQFKAQGPPPGFDYQTAMGLQQLAVGGDIQSYALSDRDFAARYPALQNAYDQWQANLGQQTGAVGAGTQGQAALMGGLANTIAGRQATPTTTDINAIRNAAATAAGAVQPIFGLGANQAGLAQPILGLGSQQAGIGQGITGLGRQVAGMAATPYGVGQQLLREPVDPLTQQQMMRAGLGSAAGALGAASLGQGMAGQAAAARQLGLNTLQYGQAMRGEAMQDIGLAASIAGQGGQLQGLGGQTIGAGAQTYGLGGQQLGAGAQTLGLGAQTAAAAGGLSGAAQTAQEAYATNTAQMAAIYGGLQNQQAMNLLGNMQAAGQLFQKRPFGLGGTNLAQTELGQAGAYNSFQQANYATMNGIAYNQAQMNAQQQQLQAQQSAGMLSAGVGAAGAVASAATAAALCWVARACFGEENPLWKQFRIWLLNCAPEWLRRQYLRHGETYAAFLSTRPALRCLTRMLLLGILRVHRRRIDLLWGLSQAGIFSGVGCAAAQFQWPNGNCPARNSRHYQSAQLSIRGWDVHPYPA